MLLVAKKILTIGIDMMFQILKLKRSQLAIGLIGILLCFNVSAESLIDFDKYWDYDRPDATEANFTKLLPMAKSSGNSDYYLQLKTQIARAQGLQNKFTEAHATLNEVEKLITIDTPVAEIRYLLERGRVFNSSKNEDLALPIFLRAFEISRNRNQDNLAIDAAHMVAIADKDPDTQLKWNLTAIDIAEHSKDPNVRGWLGSLYNNMGWTYNDSGKFESALDMFQKALVAFQEEGSDASTVIIAKWSVARVYRSLEKYIEALEIQTSLEKELREAGEVDGYVFEELGELYLVLSNPEKAKFYFALAYKELSKDEELKNAEPERIERLKLLGEVR